MWEDERNKRGGRWLITLNKQQRRSDLDRFWLETVGLAAVLCVLSIVVTQMSDSINHFSIITFASLLREVITSSHMLFLVGHTNIFTNR